MMELIVSFVSDIFQTYCYYLAFRCFFETCRLSKKGEFIAFFFFFLQTTIPHLTVNIAAVTATLAISGCIWISFIYEGTIKKRLISAVFAFSIIALSECLVAAVSGYLHLDFMESEDYVSIYAMVCLPLVEYLVVRILQNFKNIRKGENVPALYWLISGLLPIFSFCLYILFYKQIHWTQVELVAFVILLFLINIFVFFLYDRLIEHYRVEQEKENLALQNENQMNQLQIMQKTGETARQQRHDFIKHISMIAQLNREGRQKEVDEYLAEIKENVQLQQKYVQTGQFVLDSILNYKIQEAATEGINIETKIKVFPELKLSAYDMNSILTNLLDNSIEAVRELEEKRVSVMIEYVKGKLYILVKNPYNKILSQDGNYLTTKKDSVNHGYGLKIVEEIVNKYDGSFKIETEKEIFSVRICLLLD